MQACVPEHLRDFSCLKANKQSVQSYLQRNMSSFQQLTCFGFLLPRWSLSFRRTDLFSLSFWRWRITQSSAEKLVSLAPPPPWMNVSLFLYSALADTRKSYASEAGPNSHAYWHGIAPSVQQTASFSQGGTGEPWDLLPPLRKTVSHHWATRIKFWYSMQVNTRLV